MLSRSRLTGEKSPGMKPCDAAVGVSRFVAQFGRVAIVALTAEQLSRMRMARVVGDAIESHEFDVSCIGNAVAIGVGGHKSAATGSPGGIELPIDVNGGAELSPVLNEYRAAVDEGQ